MNALVALDLLRPVALRFAVTLKFTDGIYKAMAIARSSQRAIELATVDARMASPFSTHSGELIWSHAELAFDG